MYIITHTNYWQNKTGATSLYCSLIFHSLQEAKDYVDSKHVGNWDYEKMSSWISSQRGVDFDGAYVRFKIHEMKFADALIAALNQVK